MAGALQQTCALWEDSWHIYPRSVLVAVSGESLIHHTVPCRKGKFIYPTIYSDNLAVLQACTLPIRNHQQRAAVTCIQVNLHVVCNNRSPSERGQRGSCRETRSRCSLRRLAAAVCLAPRSWHRTCRCVEVASVESPYSPRCCSSFSSFKRRQFIMSTLRPKILKWRGAPKWSVLTSRWQGWHTVWARSEPLFSIKAQTLCWRTSQGQIRSKPRNALKVVNAFGDTFCSGFHVILIPCKNSFSEVPVHQSV